MALLVPVWPTHGEKVKIETIGFALPRFAVRLTIRFKIDPAASCSSQAHRWLLDLFPMCSSERKTSILYQAPLGGLSGAKPANDPLPPGLPWCESEYTILENPDVVLDSGKRRGREERSSTRKTSPQCENLRANSCKKKECVPAIRFQHSRYRSPRFFCS